MTYIVSVAVQYQIAMLVEADSQDVAEHIAMLEVRHRLASLDVERVQARVVVPDEVTF